MALFRVGRRGRLSSHIFLNFYHGWILLIFFNKQGAFQTSWLLRERLEGSNPFFRVNLFDFSISPRFFGSVEVVFVQRFPEEAMKFPADFIQ